MYTCTLPAADVNAEISLMLLIYDIYLTRLKSSKQHNCKNGIKHKNIEIIISEVFYGIKESCLHNMAALAALLYYCNQILMKIESLFCNILKLN